MRQTKDVKGTFSDYWNGGSDPNYPRHDGPFMSKPTWNAIFAQSGFSGLDFFLEDYAEQQSCSVLASTAVESTALSRGLAPLQSRGLTVV